MLPAFVCIFVRMESFNQTIDGWITALDKYSFGQLCAKPSPDGWSLGQVYMHLISETTYFLQQVKICSSNNDNAAEAMSPVAKIFFDNNELPDAIIEGPPTNAGTPQPPGKEALMQSMLSLKAEFNKAAILVAANTCKGKTKHPGLHYFNAEEWLRFADMHLRHHKRQQQRIEQFFKEEWMI